MAENFLTTEIIKNDFPDFRVMLEAFPGLSARMLGYIGKAAAVELAEMMKRGEQGIQFRNMSGNRKSGGGRRMITYSVGRGAKWVRLSSFPLNLFEGGRTLRSGKRENERNILRKTLRGSMQSRLANLIQESQSLIVDDWFNEKKKGGEKFL